MNEERNKMVDVPATADYVKEKHFSGKSQYNLSLFILVPFIISGMAVLAALIIFQFTKSYARGARPPEEITLWFIVIIVATFFCGLLITWLIMRPMRNFMKEAEKLPIFTGTVAEKKRTKVNELEQLNMVLQEVTNLLSKVEAKTMFPDIIGQSNVMRSLFSQILRVAKTDATVLITGESGTGKEMVATGIFNHSLRKKKPFIKLSCVAIPEGLLESELFGHEKGAFTGATSRKIGKFELANDGTILLDEIGDMPLETQAKLLRVLQEKEFERVGGTKPIKVDVRFIASTNKDLQKLVKEGKFREDLFYRLNVFSLVLPPLRERAEDIPLLVSYFLEMAPRPARISSTALQVLLNHSWPGNIRELKNTVERAALMADDGVVEPRNIPADILSSAGMEGIQYQPQLSRVRDSGTDEAAADGGEKLSIDDRLRDLEIKMIREALTSTAGVQARAAELLGIKERSLGIGSKNTTSI